MNETNFAHYTFDAVDRDLYYGEDFDEPILTFFPHEMLCHLMFRAGLFPSISQARKNGWNKPVPDGFSDYVVGKNKHHVWVLNREVPLEDLIYDIPPETVPFNL